MKTNFLKLICLTGILLITAASSAQNYTVESSTIGAGGGTSSGDGYSLSGGISLTGAGQLRGDGYTMDAGFWIIPPAGQPTILFDNIGGSANGGSGVTATAWLASRFCLGSQSYQLDSVSLFLNSQDSSGSAGPPSTVHLRIYASDPVTGKPSTNTGLIMNLSGMTNPITPPRGNGLVRWTNATPFTLAADTCYWAVLSRESGGSIGQIASFTKPTGEAGSFGASSSANAGETWGTPTEASNNKMLVQGIAITAPPPFIITSVSISGNDLRLSFPTQTGRSYAVESLADFTAAGWMPLPGTTNAGTGASLQTTISNAFTDPQQFFRIKRLP
jgi:hypothetical protein